MELVFVDYETLGDVDIRPFERFGKVTIYDKTAPQETAKRLETAQIVITNKVVIDDTVMAAAPELKLICVSATGVNNIDLAAAKARGIAVTNVAGYSTESVVAHTFALYFQLAHHTDYYDRYAKNEWVKSDCFTHLDRPFYELFGKRWGIIGMGTIGRRVAQVAQAFGCEVCYTSISGVPRDEVFAEMTLDELLGSCDVISIHAPLTEKTKGLLGAAELARMKPSAILLNLGRGGIVDESALAEALDNARLRGAGLDVMAKEPPQVGNKLFEIKKSYNSILSPHIAWASVEARTRLVAMIEKNIDAFLNNQILNRVV